MKLTLEKQVPLVFSIAILLLGIIVFFAFRSMNSLSKALFMQKHTQEVLLELDEILISTIDAETNGRGFLITADEIFLEPYSQAQTKIKENLIDIQNLVLDNPNQTEKIPQLEKAIYERLEILKKGVDLRRTQTLDQVRAQLIPGRGRESMNNVRFLINEMKTEEKKLLVIRETALNTNLATTYRMIWLAVIAGFISLALANWAIFREIKKRRLAENALRETNKELENRVEERTHELSQKNEDLKTEINKREETEIVLRANEEFNRSVFENSPDCVKVLELDGTLHTINQNGLCILEIDDVANFVGKQWINFWDGDESEKAHQAVEQARKGGTANFEGFCKTAKGTLRYWSVSVAPIFDSDGKPSRLISTSRDITERWEAEHEREKLLENEKSARQDAEIANRLRDEFLATVSHELRAPLNSILGWGRLLEKGKLDEPTANKAVETIVRNAEAQNRLIEDLLDVSRIISGKLRLEIVTIKPINFVEAALETVRPAADAKNITLEIKEDSGISHISGDPNRLQQVVWNLLSNAIKFTPNGGKVTAEIERLNGHIEIKIRDTGIGISAEFLPHVFDRFRQADASSIRKFGGLGLGLAIVRHLAEMHGGTVFADSTGENQGATFTVRLPVIATPKDIEEFENKEVAVKLMLENSPALSLDGLLILVVDDEEDTRQLLVQSLAFYGATVVTAKSAAEGLSELQEKNPDVLVSDIGMPEEDGYSLIRKVRALSDAHQKHTKAIALTAFTRSQDRMRALAEGYQNHVGKPVEPDELATVIASLTGRLRMD